MQYLKALLSSFLITAVAHSSALQVDLGPVFSPSDCPYQAPPQDNQNVFQHQTPYYGAKYGTAELSAILQPTPDSPSNDMNLLTSCAEQSKGVAENGRPDGGIEEKFQRMVNACLRSHAAGYEVQWVVIRRGNVKCNN